MPHSRLHGYRDSGHFLLHSYYFIRITQKITTQERSKYKAFRDYYQFMVVDNICNKRKKKEES